MTKQMTKAYAECRRLTARHGKTYYFSTQFFPKAVREDVYALYGFVRMADEIVDNPPRGSSPEAALARYRQETIEALTARPPGPSSPLVLHAFGQTARTRCIPLEYPLAFLDAMAMDLNVCRYETFDDLLKYTYGSASSVGLMMAVLIGAGSHEALRPAHDLGLAMQLTNFWRDIREDYDQRGRIYIPLEDMRRFGYSEADLARGVIDDRFCELMRFEVARARQIYRVADLGMCLIPAPNRLPVRLARVLYSRILNKIEQNGYDVFSNRASTSGWEKLTIACRESLVPWRC